MFIKAYLGLALLMVFTSPAFSQSFVGEWTATATSEAGSTAEVLNVVKVGTGYTLTAKVVVPLPAGAPEAGPGTDIVLDGDHFSFKRTVTTPEGSLVITYTGVVTGDTFTGIADLGFARVQYNGVRIKHPG